MILFIAIFLTLYTFLHSVVFWGIYPLLKGKRSLIISCVSVMFVMMLMPIVVRLLEKANYHLAPRILAWVAFIWMGAVFIAFSLSVLLVLWEIVAAALKYFVPQAISISLRSKRVSAILLLIVACACCYGYYEASHIRVEHVKLYSTKLSANDKFVVAQVSDMHLGLMRQKGELVDVIEKLEDLQPDILVSTGDMVDAQINHLDGMAPVWASFNPPMGKYAVTGNHEYYAGLDNSVEFMESAGFTMLRGRVVQVADKLNIAGIDDPARGEPGEDFILFNGIDKDRYTVFMKHRPEVDPMAVGLFDLQLSGHTHRGQIFPFNFLTAMQYPMQDGLYRLENDSLLYTSRGTGTWGPPMRILSPPHITVFEIMPVDQGNKKP